MTDVVPEPTAPTRTLLIERANGNFTKVENIPPDAKVTFGGVNPTAQGYNKSYCLRVYTSKDNQLAVFTDVVAFRDSTLKIMERKIKRNSTSGSEFGPNGGLLRVEAVSSAEWEEVEDGF